MQELLPKRENFIIKNIKTLRPKLRNMLGDTQDKHEGLKVSQNILI